MNPPDERYFTSTPCSRGHIGRRYKSTGACVECMAIHGKAKRLLQAEQRRKIKEQTCDSQAP